MFYLLLGTYLAFIPLPESKPILDDPLIQKTSHNNRPPPQTSNPVFLKSQKTVFDNQSPRTCKDGRIILKNEKCEDLPPMNEEDPNQTPLQGAPE